ncbi:hypothetical protein CsSME_00004977 [Camellia sinensis var. sinensis]
MGGSNAWRLGMKSLLTPGTRTLKASAVGLDSLTPLWLIISPLSTLVAARVTQENAEYDEWFVVKVIHFDRETRDYVLEFDDDEEKDGSLLQRIVPFHRVVGLPEGHCQ